MVRKSRKGNVIKMNSHINMLGICGALTMPYDNVYIYNIVNNTRIVKAKGCRSFPLCVSTLSNIYLLDIVHKGVVDSEIQPWICLLSHEKIVGIIHKKNGSRLCHYAIFIFRTVNSDFLLFNFSITKDVALFSKIKNKFDYCRNNTCSNVS